MKRLRVIFILSCLLLLIGAGFYYFKQKLETAFNTINQTESLNSSDVEMALNMVSRESETQWVNIALFGLDVREEIQSRSDAIKVVSLNLKEREIKVTSFQRDLLVYIPSEVNDFSKLNHAYQYGGARLAIKTLNCNFDLDITRYVTLNFNSLEDIVDALGGIEVDIKPFEVDYSKLLHKSGNQILNGEQALGYARMRQPDNDYERMDRQYTVMKSIFNKMKSLSLSELYQLLDQCLPHVETNLTKDEIMNWGLSALQLDLKDIESYQVPINRYQDINQQVSYKNMKGLNILNSYEQTVQSLHEFIYELENYEVSQQLIEIEKSVYEQFGFLVK